VARSKHKGIEFRQALEVGRLFTEPTDLGFVLASGLGAPDQQPGDDSRDGDLGTQDDLAAQGVGFEAEGVGELANLLAGLVASGLDLPGDCRGIECGLHLCLLVLSIACRNSASGLAARSFYF
jgi:hypothetical protein